MTRRFRKGTLDHDGDGKKGGSLPAVPKRAKKPKAKTEPEPTPLDPADRKLFELGRVARRSGVKRGDSPYSGRERDLWLSGWDYQDKA
jgi:hypothetical protein